MDIESYRQYCLSKKGVTEGFPFDNQTLVFKVMGKMFALADVDEFVSVNLKCDPQIAPDLRADYPDTVLPGYHMNKKHWNTVVVDGTPDNRLLKWTDDSYDLVVETLTKKLKEELKSL